MRPDAMDALKGCELILHAGDIGDARIGPRVLEALRTLAGSLSRETTIGESWLINSPGLRL